LLGIHRNEICMSRLLSAKQKRCREFRCICLHVKDTHLFDGDESVCMREGCRCVCFHLWEVTLCDPFGKTHKVHDVAKFVRESGLFSDDELILMRRHGVPHITRAEIGISSLIQAEANSWHGWELVTFPKTYLG
jgi:hypothetical protein